MEVTFRKQLTKMNAKLVVALEKIATRGSGYKRNIITVGPVNQEATIHQKNAHTQKKNTRMNPKNMIKWLDQRAYLSDKKEVKTQIE